MMGRDPAMKMNDVILSQIDAIRVTGLTNMLDYRVVQRIAFDRQMYELVNYIEENPARYFHFIITGKEDLECTKETS